MEKWVTAKWKQRSEETLIRHLAETAKMPNKPNVVLIGTSMFEHLNEEEEFLHYASKYNIVNYGCGGDTIPNIIWRVENGLLRELAPLLVILMAGANDIEKAPVEGMLSGMQRIVKDIRDALPDAKVCIIGMFPRLTKIKKITEQNLYDKIAEYNKGLAKLYGNDYWYAGEKIMKDGVIDRNYMTDLVHLNSRGNRHLIETICEIINVNQQ